MRVGVHDAHGAVGFVYFAFAANGFGHFNALLQGQCQKVFLPFLIPALKPEFLVGLVVSAKLIAVRNQHHLVVDQQKFWIWQNFKPSSFGKLLTEQEVAVAMHEIQHGSSRFCTLNCLDNSLAGAVAVVVSIPNLKKVTEQKDERLFLSDTGQPVFEGFQCFGRVFGKMQVRGKECSTLLRNFNQLVT